MQNLNAAAGRRHLDHKLLLQAGLLFDRRRGYDGAARKLYVDGKVVQSIGDRRRGRRLRSHPQTMSAAILPCGFSAPAHLPGKFVEQIAAADEGVAHDARSDVASDNQFHFAIGHAIAVRPSLIVCFLDFCNRFLHLYASFLWFTWRTRIAPLRDWSNLTR